MAFTRCLGCPLHFLLVKRAEKAYETALKMFYYDAHVSPAEKAQIDALRVTCFSNMAACRLKLNDPSGVLAASNEALAIDK